MAMTYIDFLRSVSPPALGLAVGKLLGANYKEQRVSDGVELRFVIFAGSPFFLYEPVVERLTIRAKRYLWWEESTPERRALRYAAMFKLVTLLGGRLVLDTYKGGIDFTAAGELSPSVHLAISHLDPALVARFEVGDYPWLEHPRQVLEKTAPPLARSRVVVRLRR